MIEIGQLVERAAIIDSDRRELLATLRGLHLTKHEWDVCRELGVGHRLFFFTHIF